MRRKHTESCLLRRQVCTTVQLHPCQRGLLSGTSGRRSPGVGVGGANKNKITASLSDRSASQTRGLQSPAPGRGEQTGEAARLPQATLCLASSEAATKPPTREQCPRPRRRSLPGRRRTPSPTGSPLSAMFLGCFVPRETPTFSLSAGGENRALTSETGDRPLPHPLAAAGDAGAAAWASAALCCAPWKGPHPRALTGPRLPPQRPHGPGAAFAPAGDGSSAPRGEPALPGMRSPPAAPLLVPALPRSPSLSLTHAVLLVLRGYPHARGVRAPVPPPAPPPGAAVAGKRVRCPGLPPRSAAAARPQRRRHCSGGRTN